MHKKLINPAELYDGSANGMSQAVHETNSNLIFISGQVAWDTNFQITDPTLEGQFKQALENLDRVLAASKASVENLVHVKIYVRGEVADHMEALQPIISQYLGTSKPSLTGIGVASLASPETLVEIEAIASV
ncbi:MAG TPA: RidA family protein [Microscillaceae bacterium]|nr:RidA family protein [Microscillaceae bacterium]